MDDADAAPSLGKLFSILHWQTRIFVERELASINLTWGEFHILMQVCHAGQMSQRDVTRQLRISKATTSKMLRKLEQEGYIRRKEDEQDRRTYLIHTTEQAQGLHAKLRDISSRWNHMLLGDLTPEERGVIVAGLNAMVQRALQANREAPDA